MYYQLFEGVDPEDYKVVVDLKDQDTEEVYDTIVYPDALDEENEQKKGEQTNNFNVVT